MSEQDLFTAGPGVHVVEYPFRNEREFYPRLESARGIAALMVAFFHVGQAKWADSTQLVGSLPAGDHGFWHQLFRILTDGHGAVLFFFVLSGFVLAPHMTLRNDPLFPLAMRFAWARAARIWPAAAFTLLVFSALYLTTGYHLATPQVYEPWNLLLNFLLVRTNMNGVMWTLSAELLAVPVLLAAAIIWRLAGWIGVIIFAAALAGTLQFSSAVPATLGVTGDESIKFTNLYAFVFGMLARPIGSWVIARLSPVFIAILAVFWVAVFLFVPQELGLLSSWSTVVKVTASSGLIAILAFAPIGGPARLLDASPVRFLGRVSFSFYLLHPLTLIVVWNMPETLGRMVAAGTSPPLIAFVLGALTCIVTLPFAWLMWRYVELPGVKAGRWMIDRWPMRSATVVAPIQRGSAPTRGTVIE